MRIDKELVNRNIFNSRSKAMYAINNGCVFCNGECIIKPSFDVKDDDEIVIKGEVLKYVSKGGLKLEKAINTFNINLKDKIIIDIGSSTGGFCDCALMNGAQKIYAIDVGTNQLDQKLRNDNRIIVYEQTDFRNIDINKINDATIITMDVSFISITKLLNKIKELENVNKIICLIKPQFECGKDIANKYKGKPLNKDIHKNILKDIIREFNNINYYIENLSYSPIKGGDGNIEYISLFNKRIKKNNQININEIVEESFKAKLK